MSSSGSKLTLWKVFGGVDSATGSCEKEYSDYKQCDWKDVKQ